MAGIFRGKKFTMRLILVLLIVLLVVVIQILSVSRISSPKPYPWEELPHSKGDEGGRVDEWVRDKERGLRTVQTITKQDSLPENKREERKQIADESPSTALPLSSETSPSSQPITSPSTAPPPVAPIHFCYITSKDAVSAINRAKTETCRNLIRNITCLTQAGKLYDTEIKNSCPIGRNPTRAFQHVPYENGVGPLPRVMYLLSVHGRALRQIQRLFKTLYHSDHYFFIHVDSRSEYLYREIERTFTDYPNVYIPNWQMTTIWGGSSLLQMLLRSLEDIEYKLSHWKWDFFINLSESDYPLKSNDELVQFLRVHHETNFVKTHGGDVNKFIQKQGLDRTFVECDNHMWRVTDRQLPPDIIIDGGSDWIVINRNYSRYLVTTNNSFLNGLKKYYQYSLLPAESFFHTVLRNGPLCSTLVRSNLHITNWNRRLGCLCQYKHIVDWCGCSPNDFLPKDMNRLKNPGNQNFFGRKFEAIVNQEVINELHSHIYGPFPEDAISLSSYWQNVYHNEDVATKPSSARYTVYQSFLRQGLRLVSKSGNESRCLASLGKPIIKEVSVYHAEDRFIGFVLRMQEAGTADNGRPNEHELLVRPNTMFKIEDQSEEISRRITSFEVGSEWDGKESIFRNYGGILGVHDTPVAAVRLVVGKLGHIAYIWENPIGMTVERHDTKLEPSSVINTKKLNIERPLMPGVWKVRLEINSKVYITHEFLVTPLFYDGTVPLWDPVSVNARQMNHSNTELSMSDGYREWSHNVVKTGSDLLNWIDQLVSRFWAVQAVCTLGVSSCKNLPSCEDSRWSTSYPDPKSELGPVQPNGRIL